MHAFAVLSNFANAVVNDQPAVSRQDRRSAAADFETLPWRYRSRQPMMRELVDETRSKSLHGNRAVGNPDAFAIKILRVGAAVASDLLRSSSRKEGPVKQGQLRLPGRIRNGCGERTGILVVHVAEIQPLKRSKRDKPEPLPAKQIL